MAVVAIALVALPAMAQAKTFGGIVRDVPTGARADVSMVSPQSALPSPALPYGGGPVLHSNRTHPIFWEPAGSGLTFDAGYESLIETFLVDDAADSRKTTNVYSLSGQYRDRSGPAAYDSTYGGAVVDTRPVAAERLLGAADGARAGRCA